MNNELDVKFLPDEVLEFKIDEYTIKAKRAVGTNFINVGDLAKYLGLTIKELSEILYDEAGYSHVKAYNYVATSVLKCFDDKKYDDFIWTIINNIIPYLENN
jgi:hypothetical protein